VQHRQIMKWRDDAMAALGLRRADMSDAAATVNSKRRGKPRRGRFFLGMSTLVLVLAVAGFVPSLYLRQLLWPDVFNPQHGPTLPTHLYLHGIALSAWFVVAWCQAVLVARRRVRIHRRLGVAGLVIAAAVVATSLLTTVMRDAPIVDESPSRAFPQLLTLTAFTLCVVGGALRRRHTAEHKRLMLFASLAVVGPGITRLLSNVGIERYSLVGGIALLGMLALIPLYDLITERRIHRGTALGFGLIVLGLGNAFLLTRTSLWPSLVRLLV